MKSSVNTENYVCRCLGKITVNQDQVYTTCIVHSCMMIIWNLSIHVHALINVQCLCMYAVVSNNHHTVLQDEWSTCTNGRFGCQESSYVSDILLIFIVNINLSARKAPWNLICIARTRVSCDIWISCNRFICYKKKQQRFMTVSTTHTVFTFIFF